MYKEKSAVGSLFWTSAHVIVFCRGLLSLRDSIACCSFPGEWYKVLCACIWMQNWVSWEYPVIPAFCRTIVKNARRHSWEFWFELLRHNMLPRSQSKKHNWDTCPEYKLDNSCAQIPVLPSNSGYVLQHPPLTPLWELLRDRDESTLLAEGSVATFTEEWQHEHKVKNTKMHSGSLLPGWHVVHSLTSSHILCHHVHQGALGQTSMCCVHWNPDPKQIFSLISCFWQEH